MLQKSHPAVDDPVTSYRGDIDGLRALAVLSVVVFHAFPGLLPGGFIGVDIFFVISGYLISGHIVQAMNAGTFSLVRFYQRRIRRILPALILVLVACLAFGWITLMADEYQQLGKHVAASAGFIANFVFWQEVGYFDNTSITKPLLHLWSLAIEEQFYLLWPLIVWAGWKLRTNMLTLIVVAAVLSWSFNLATVGPDASAAFYSPQTRFWELLLGAGLAEMERRGTLSLSPFIANMFVFLGVMLICIGLFWISENQPFPGWRATIPTVGAVLIIAGGPGAHLSRHVLANRVAVGIGLISYPLYLWHWPLLSFGHIIESQTPTWETQLALVIASTILAAATYLFIERPVRFGKWKAKSLSVPLLVAMALVGSGGYWIFTHGGLTSRLAAQGTPKVSSQFVGSMWAYTNNENCLKRYRYEEAEKYGWWFCMLEKPEAPTVLITGGSYANQIYPGLANNLNFDGQNFLSIGTCAPLQFEGLNGPVNYKPCSGPYWVNQNRFIEKILRDEPTIRTVIIGGLSSDYTEESLDLAVKRIEALSATGAQIIVFSPHYRGDVDVRGCFPRPIGKPRVSCEITGEKFATLMKKNASLEQALKEKAPNIMFFEQNRIFCRGDHCSLIADGYPLIRDVYQHISEYGSSLIGNIFVDWAKANYPSILDRDGGGK